MVLFRFRNFFNADCLVFVCQMMLSYIIKLISFSFQRCVVVQEVYPDGLIAMDGRLQPGDQIIEINGADMTCAPHSQVMIYIVEKGPDPSLLLTRTK